MPLTFKQRNFIATDHELMVVGLDRAFPAVFVIDLSIARISLDLKATGDVLRALERWRDVLETACRRAYARRVRGREYSRIRVDEEDFRAVLTGNVLPVRA